MLRRCIPRRAAWLLLILPAFPAWSASEATEALTLTLSLSPSLSPTLHRILGAVLLFLIASITSLFLSSVATRILRERSQRRSDRFNERWEPMLYACMSGDTVRLPPLAASERLLFLQLWLPVLNSVRGESADALVQTARELGLARYALRLIDARAPWKRVIGMQAVAALRLDEARAVLLAKILQDRPGASLFAARALMLIDPERGLIGLAHVLDHLEWSPGAMLEILKAAGTRAGPVLAARVRAAAPGRAKRLVRLIELLGDEAALPALRERLLSNRDQEEIAAILHCLGKLGGAEDRVIILAFLDHAKWVVRLQAAHALGSLGNAEDVGRLVPLVRDPYWWVRYRTAQSLFGLAGAVALTDMRERESDPYAREMLSLVLAESP